MIQEISLKNFRKHKDMTLDFSEKKTALIGENGSGKTSVIESIFVMLTGKSWRSSLAEITRDSADWWRADLRLDTDDIRTIKYQTKQAEFIVKDKSFKRLPRKFRESVILFEPNDLNLVAGSPARRRDYFDRLFMELDDDFATAYRRYQKVLKQRNSLLKNQASRDSLFAWNIQFANLASEIIVFRRDKIQEINNLLTKEYRVIHGGENKLKILYDYYDDESRSTIQQKILSKLDQNYNYEIIIGHSSIGPHKHNFIFEIDGRAAENVISRGENRSLILALKKIEYQFKKKDKPLILLDDVLSEFDEQRQKNLLDSYKDSQIIITSVNLPKNIEDINIIKFKN